MKESKAGQIVFSFCLEIYPERLIKARINYQSVQIFLLPETATRTSRIRTNFLNHCKAKFQKDKSLFS